MTKGVFASNNPGYPSIPDWFKDQQKGEGHLEPGDVSFFSNINILYDIHEAEGLKNHINMIRGIIRSSEEKLKGEIKEKVLIDIMDAARKTGVPYEMLVFAVDWAKNLDERDGAGDAMEMAQKLISNSMGLKKALGRDPLRAEVFGAHILGSVGEMVKRVKLAQSKPNDPAPKHSGHKADIINIKVGSAKKGNKQRTNKEFYDWFYKRLPTGRDFVDFLPLISSK